MGSSKQTGVSIEERREALLDRLGELEEKLDNRRRHAGYAGKTIDAQNFHRMRDDLRAIQKDFKILFSDTENEKTFSQLSKKPKSEKVTEHAGKNRI